MSKEELEILLKAFKIMHDNDLDMRKSLTTLEADIKDQYVKLVMSEL